jgi:adenosine deaminase
MRDLGALPKAHLHLHLTGSMRPATLLELADLHGIRLPDALTSGSPPELLATDARGWFRFQRLYDIARSVLRTDADIRRIITEAAEEERREGSQWLELQVEPAGYAAIFGGITAVLEIVLDAAADATRTTGVGIGVIVAANRTRHPLDARTNARLAARYADRGVIGFGLSNDERRGRAEDFAPAFRIARDAGLLAVPHGGELLGAASVAECIDLLGAVRIGHGVRVVEEPQVLDRVAAAGITLEVCPASNVALGVAPEPGAVPLRRLREAGVAVALGADDPLLFGSRLLDQYQAAREVHGLTDTEIAALARDSVVGSTAPAHLKRQMLDGIAAWLGTELAGTELAGTAELPEGAILLGDDGRRASSAMSAPTATTEAPTHTAGTRPAVKELGLP